MSSQLLLALPVTAAFAALAYRLGMASPRGAAGGILGLMPLLLVFIVFYFLMIRPQQRRAKALQQAVAAVKRGDDRFELLPLRRPRTPNDIVDGRVTDGSAGTLCNLARARLASRAPKGVQFISHPGQQLIGRGLPQKLTSHRIRMVGTVSDCKASRYEIVQVLTRA